MSLDTKYRPKTYSDVIGQNSIVKVLKGIVSSDAGWRQSYLFAGPYGSGKTTTARILARALLCENTINGEPCDKCFSCLSMLEGNCDSYIEVDSATNSGKADVKKLLEEIDYTTFSGRRRLYLFDESHRLSTEALDALLKPMEDNRPHSLEKRLVCIFATTEPEKMRQTILSRCAPAFIIKQAPTQDIANRLAFVCEQEKIEYEQEGLKLIADITEGHIRDALKAIEGVASANKGVVSGEGVRSYLHIDRNDIVAKLLIASSKDTLELAKTLLENTPVGVAYDRVVEACMLAISFGLGASTIPPYWNSKLIGHAWDLNGNKLLELADNMSKKPIRPTNSVFLCDLLKWKNDFKNLPTTLVLSNKPQENQTTTIKKVEKFDIPMFMNIVKQKYKDLSKN